MNNILDVKQNRRKCQVFTPDNIIDLMLDTAEYRFNVIGKKVLEPSFGSGKIIKKIIFRYIDDAFRHNYSSSQIAIGLSNDIYGIELDKELYDKTIDELNNILIKYGISNVNWKLFNSDTLKIDINIKFDFIVGNPPYIEYRNINKEDRDYLKNKYVSCKYGKFDYCYAFIEKAINCLNKTGKMVQLVPNNIYKNVYGFALREKMKKHISLILDFPEQKIFNGFLTSSSIFLYDCNNNRSYFEYRNMTLKINKFIDRDYLKDKWIFMDKTCILNKSYRFGDFFSASISVATLLNEAFVLNENQVNKFYDEQDIIRPASSPRGCRFCKKEYIIFPYYFLDGKLKKITYDDFLYKYPKVLKHLEYYKNKLEMRDKDKSSQWFEYGRSQALAHLNQKKLLMSTIVTKNIEIYNLSKENIPFSGIYIVQKKNNLTLDYAQKILKSREFMEYVCNIGIRISGKSIRITSKDINNFEFSWRNYGES